MPSSRNWRLVQSSQPAEVSPYGLGDPTMPLAVSSALWFSFRGVNRLPFNSRPKPLCEFRLPPESYPTDPSRPTAVHQLLSWALSPFSTFQDRRSTCSRVSPTRYVPPSGFGYPRDGLLPSVPGRFCFAPAALLGFTLRSFTFPQVSRRFRLEEPTYRLTCRCSHRRSVGPARQAAVPGLCPCRRPRSATGGFSTCRYRELPWGSPFQGASRRPWPGFRPASSHTLCRFNRERPHRPASQSLDQPSLRSALPARFPERPKATSPLRVSAPA
jgi:hypothetical protein